MVVFVRSFLSVWPIQLHFLLLIVVLISSCLVFFQSCLFDILLGHHTLRMYRRRLLMKTWSLLLRDSSFPRFTAIEKNWFNVGVENADLCVYG